MKNNKKAFSFIEVLVASALMGFAAIVVMQLQSDASKQTRKILDVSSSVKALLNIQKKIIEEDRYLPAQDALPAAQTWSVAPSGGGGEAASAAPAVDPWSLLGVEGASGAGCFDVSGTWILCPKEKKEDAPNEWLNVRYEARYVKVRVLDRSAGLSPSLRRIPLARFYIEVSYPKDKQEREVLRFTRLVTNAMLY